MGVCDNVHGGDDILHDKEGGVIIDKEEVFVKIQGEVVELVADNEGN